MGQVLSTTIYDTVAVTLTSATLTITQGAYTLGPVTAAISPSAAATAHVLSYELPDTLPVGLSAGSVSLAWNWLRNGSARSADTSDTIAFPLTGPLTCVTTPSPVVCRAGDTAPSFTAVLGDANGSVDVSTATLTLFVRAAWNPDNIPGGTAQAIAGTTGAVTCTLPTLSDDGYYYGYITDGRGGSYPDTGSGFLITVAPSVT
jgi:hypothetical protein